jgi:multidrug efflux pump subunit AcrA (membrane-fusion protein)
MSAASHPLPVQQPEVAPPPSPRQPVEHRSRKWLIALVIVVLAGIVIWRLTARTEPAKPAAAVPAGVRTAAASTGNIERTIRVAGQTSAIEFANVTAPIMRGRESGQEMILLYLAPAGSWVKKGQMIAQIDAQSMQDHVDDLGDTIATAESDIRKRQAEQAIDWESLQQSLRVAKSTFDKYGLEYKATETQTEIQRQLAKLSLDEAEAAHKQLQADLAQKKATYDAELKILDITLKRHIQHRDRHARDIKAFTMYASMDGLAVMQQTFRGGEFGQVQQGDRVGPGQPFMKIVNTKTMQVEGTINQTESSRFRVGQPARIKLDAFPGLEFNGKVHSIGALAVGGWRQNQYIRTVPIRLAIEGNDPRLIPDLSASADVILERAQTQVLIPLGAVHSENGKTVVHVKAGETFDRREVDLGVRSDTHAAVVSGLRAGELVRLN